MGRERHRGEVEHQVRDHRADARARHLRDHVDDGVRGGDPAEQSIGESDDRVEVRARHRPERQDQRHEPGAGRDRVLEQLQADVVG